MYNYPNYSQYQNQMNNYQQNPYNPNVFNPYDRSNVMQYQQNMQSAQNMSAANIQNGLIGGMVDDFNSITANDVPMDGKPATFIKRDMSEIQLRLWNSSGQIQTVVFKPFVEESNNDKAKGEEAQIDHFKSLEDIFNSSFAEMNQRFDKLEKAITPTKTVTRGKKEVSADD